MDTTCTKYVQKWSDLVNVKGSEKKTINNLQIENRFIAPLEETKEGRCRYMWRKFRIIENIVSQNGSESDWENKKLGTMSDNLI